MIPFGRYSIVLALLTATCAAAPAAQASDPPCDRVAALSGNDASAGAPGAPVRTIGRLFAVLSPGQTGCLTAGETFHEIITVKPSGTAEAPLRLRSTAGGRATITGQIRFTGSHIDIEGVDFGGTAAVGDTYAKTYHLGVDGDDVRIADADISSPRGICVDVGQIDAYGGVRGARADDFVLEDSRIHGCGLRNYADGQLTRKDSGVHGIYLKHTLGARISGNAIYDNIDRGIQLWPAAEGTLIEGNVLDGNGSNLNLGSYAPNGFFSRDTTVRGNVISNSQLRSCDTCDFPPGDTAQVLGNFPAGQGDFGNVVEGNCVFHRDPSRNFDGNGFRVGENRLAEPVFADRAAGDFRQTAGSPCAEMGIGTVADEAEEADEPPAVDDPVDEPADQPEDELELDEPEPVTSAPATTPPAPHPTAAKPKPKPTAKPKPKRCRKPRRGHHHPKRCRHHKG
jgi:parallel beta-helix repeat protein